MRRIMRTWAGTLVPVGVLCLAALATGCSGSGTITGKVTYQKQPLTGGTVLFTSTAGKGSRTATIGEDGSYTITNMPTGPAKIAVDTRTAQARPGPFGGAPPSMQPPKDVQLPDTARSGGLYGPPSGKKATAVPIPERYADPEKSGLTYTVKSGSQTHPIDLE